MLQSRTIAVPDDWLRALTKDDLATGCQEAWLSPLPSKAKKDEWVAHCSGQLSLHHLSIHGLEKVCKHNKLSAFQGKPKAQLIKMLETSGSAQSGQTAVQPDIADVMANLVINQQSLLSEHRLHVLTCEQLQELCRARVLPAYGSKQDMIRQLQQDNMTLKELSKSELKALCKAEQLPVSGSIATLIERLQQPPTAKQTLVPPKQQEVHDEQKAQEVAVSKSGDLLQEGKKMVSIVICRRTCCKCYVCMCASRSSQNYHMTLELYQTCLSDCVNL